MCISVLIHFPLYHNFSVLHKSFITIDFCFGKIILNTLNSVDVVKAYTDDVSVGPV